MNKIVNPVCEGQDPFILLYKDTYYQYLQSKDDMGYDVLISKDLQKWENSGRCLYKDDCMGDKEFWAPDGYKYYDEIGLSMAIVKSEILPFYQAKKFPIHMYCADNEDDVNLCIREGAVLITANDPVPLMKRLERLS